MQLENKEKLKNILNGLNEIVVYRNIINHSLIKRGINILQELLKEKPSIKFIYSEYSSFYKGITEYALKRRIHKNIWPTFWQKKSLVMKTHLAGFQKNMVLIV